MAWYYGTYSCGHEGRVNVVGKMSERQWKIDRHFEGICENCKAKQIEESNKKINGNFQRIRVSRFERHRKADSMG